jgi:phosphonate transport system substrate-binding protein
MNVMRPARWRAIILLAILLVLTSLARGEAANEGKAMRISVHPYLSPSELQKRFQPLTEYLTKTLRRPVSLEICKDYEEHIIKAGENRAEISFMGPVSYVKMVEAYGRHPILGVLEISGRHTFQGVIFTAEESRMRSLSDLRGSRFAFGDQSSTMSHLVPRYMLLQAGIDVKDLSKHEFLSNHDNVALGVLIGEFDAGAVKEEVFRKYEKRGIRVLAKTPEIAEHLFVASSDLPPEAILALRVAFRGLRDESNGKEVMWAIKKNMTGIVPAEDGDYDNLRRILSELRERGVGR